MPRQIIRPKPKDLGGFTVKRILPSPALRTVGPFIFLDEMGPADFPPGQGISVRPHPHVCLATITFLFEGEILHQDTTGAHQVITPGDVNWMHAGKGIVHSERPGPNVDQGGKLWGLQAWVGLPSEVEETEPYFDHQPGDHLPKMDLDGAHLTIIAGQAYGQRAPTRVESHLHYVNAILVPGATLSLPDPDDHEDRGVYVLKGPVTITSGEANTDTVDAGAMIVTDPSDTHIQAGADGAHIMLFGGARLDGERHLTWNFASSRADRLQQAQADWIASSQANFSGSVFTLPEGDNHEYIPYPGSEFTGVVEPSEDCPVT